MKMKCMKDLEIFSALSPAERDQVGDLAIKKIYKKMKSFFEKVKHQIASI